MDEKEYEKFMAYLYNEYVRTRISRLREHFHPMEWGYTWGREWERLSGASNLLRYINQHCQNEDEIYRTFTQERIIQLPGEIRDGVRANNSMLEKSGFMDAMDAYYDEIVDGMKLEYMPEQEIEVMRKLGSADPEAELTALMYIVKSKNRQSYNQEVRISSRLKEIEKKIDHQHEQLKELKETLEKPAKKSKRWFKGLGQIAQGSALSIANVALAMGAITVPVAAETAGWGAIISSITGVGIVVQGVGEFRGE